MSADAPADDAGEEGAVEETNSADTRWAYTNDILAVLITVAWVGLVGYGVRTGAQLPSQWVIDMATAVVVISMGVWAFGKGGVEVIKQLRK